MHLCDQPVRAWSCQDARMLSIDKDDEEIVEVSFLEEEPKHRFDGRSPARFIYRLLSEEGSGILKRRGRMVADPSLWVCTGLASAYVNSRGGGCRGKVATRRSHGCRSESPPGAGSGWDSDKPAENRDKKGLYSHPRDYPIPTVNLDWIQLGACHSLRTVTHLTYPCW